MSTGESPSRLTERLQQATSMETEGIGELDKVTQAFIVRLQRE